MNAPSFATVPFHPLADIFPLIDGEDFANLRDDIAAHGVREPVVLFEGAILDGRNRYRAAQVAGVDCPMVEYRGDDPAAFVISLNLRRRHLTESQRAMAAAKLANMRQGERTDIEPSANLRKVSTNDAAQSLNVSPRSVESARKVHAEAAAGVSDAVERGDLSVSLAAQATALPKEDQAEIVARNADRQELRKAMRAALCAALGKLEARK